MSAVIVTVEVTWSEGPKRYEDDEIGPAIEELLDGQVIYVTSANGDDETGLLLDVRKVELTMSASLLAPLTRPELDALLADAEHAYTKSHIALAGCELLPETVAAFAGVAQDCLCMWQDALDESIYRRWHGEPA